MAAAPIRECGAKATRRPFVGCAHRRELTSPHPACKPDRGGSRQGSKGNAVRVRGSQAHALNAAAAPATVSGEFCPICHWERDAPGKAGESSDPRARRSATGNESRASASGGVFRRDVKVGARSARGDGGAQTTVAVTGGRSPFWCLACSVLVLAVLRRRFRRARLSVRSRSSPFSGSARPRRELRKPPLNRLTDRSRRCRPCR